MVIAVTGSGGKTTLIHKMASEYIKEGKKVFVTTSTHMAIEEDTLLSDDAEAIISLLSDKGYAMAGIKEGEKIKALSYETYKKVSEHADVTLVEADGSARRPIKYPNATEPVIYDNIDEIIVVTSLLSIGKPLKEAAHRIELVTDCLGVDADCIVTPEQVQKLLRKGYLEKMTDAKIKVNHDGSLYQRALAGLIEADMDVDNIKEEWFGRKPAMFICGAGHVAKETAEFASKLDFDVTVMDDRDEFANEERFPDADIICDSMDNLGDYLISDGFYVVVTRGHKDDFECVKKILNTPYRYLGMIGSRIKVSKTIEMLREEGFSEEKISSIHAPIGLKIGAATPGEIAVSILAEIIEVKNRENTSSISEKLRTTDEHGMLCIIVDKTGSSPRGIGSMMLVMDNKIIDSIGGGAIESAVIEDARRDKSVRIEEYHLNNRDSERLGMICGGSNKVLFIPV